eukprot:TRINITY_DN58_c0_g2_i2.p1 TRINITY_DN58_c0_g2~~TRINITY_DN58_c0_g2_i2.p1  ORF type:complete len:470 (+),score=265.47 TRINITY_DN58_c0_g2_i2:218-1627(+)
MPDVQTRKRRSASFSLGAAPAAPSAGGSGGSVVARRAAAKHSLQHSSPAAAFKSSALVATAVISERADNERDVAARHFATLQQLTATHAAPVSVAAANMQRNRYANVVADDVSRVPLRAACDGSDYVNASRVAARMIATQAPLAHTVEHFWQMVCEERSRVVVCLTKFEIGRAACYFPSAGRTQRYGAVQVTTRGSVQYGRELTVRYLLVQRDNCAAPPHAVMHLYYSGWPDFGVPSSHEPLLRLFALMHTFDRKLAAQTAHDGLDEPGDERAPFVVHCSAGIGRAGTFIAAALLIEQLLDGSLELDSIVDDHNDDDNDNDNDDDEQQQRVDIDTDADVDVDDDDSCTSGQVAPNGDELNALHLDTTLVDAVLDAMLRPAHSSYVPAAAWRRARRRRASCRDAARSVRRRWAPLGRLCSCRHRRRRRRRRCQCRHAAAARRRRCRCRCRRRCDRRQCCPVRASRRAAAR